MKQPEEEELNSKYFIDFNGLFHGRLSSVIPRRYVGGEESKLSGVSARYECRIKVEYHRNLMRLLEEGMILAVRNFKSDDKCLRFTLMEVSKVWPEHFGLKGLPESGYYPLQFEVIEQSEIDWESNDKDTMIIQMSAIPVNYDLVLTGENEPEFVKCFSYPIIGSKTHILNMEMINKMYNKQIVDKLGITEGEMFKVDPKIGLIKMFEAEDIKIPIYIDFENLIRYHFGVFAFTGGGKSNLLSSLLRKIIYCLKDDVKVVIFDISCEYPFLLMDVLSDPEIEAKVILENEVKTVDEFFSSIVKPRKYENDERVKDGLAQIMEKDRVTCYIAPLFEKPTYKRILDELETLKDDSIGKPHYINAIEEIIWAVVKYMDERKLTENDELDEEFIDMLDATARNAVEKFKIHDKSGLYAWATTRVTMKDTVSHDLVEENTSGVSSKEICKLIEDEETKLVCISISDPEVIKSLVIDVLRRMLARRKKRFQVKPYVLFVLDEAQEFIPDYSSSSGLDKTCSKQVETLLRQGRKYGLGACIATQRIAYLNTNALQQLHTYFVGTLPRPYDRSVISNTFLIDPSILEKTLEFNPGEWLLSSYIATGMENVPIFIKADDTEETIEAHLKKLE
ncbi:MAG: ATP-binding protein [Candidatus Odinarchaeia archaeon]